MNDCDRIRTRLERLAAGEPAGEIEDALMRHLDRCPDCRRSLDGIERILQGAGEVRGDIAAALASVDWDATAERIADAAFAAPAAMKAAGRQAAGPSLSPFRRRLFQPRFRPVYAALLTGVVLGAAGMFAVLKSRPAGPAVARGFSASRDFIDQVEYQLARRETLDYLDKSQLLILDFVQAPPGQARLLQKSPEAEPAREMLAKKRNINLQLGSVRMAKAREICNQIEVLFLELAAVSGELSPADAAQIKDYIEQQQLLLKIKLLKKELQESEV
jgi:hypothetical protein